MSIDKEILMELRWDPVLGEWVIVSNLRRHRPWQPEDFCPFCPGAPETGYGWRVLILENKYPILTPNPPEPTKHDFYKTSKALGKCFVVIETPYHNLDDLSDLGVDDITYVLKLVIEKQREVEKDEYAEYFLWFRNKGKEIGVSLTHPHSQIYVTPFIPSKVALELENSRFFWELNKSCLFCSIISTEIRENIRIVHSSRYWVSFIPFYAHWPYEVHIYSRRHIQLLTHLTDEEIEDLAKVLKVVLCGLKNLFQTPSPYVMVLHQAPLKNTYPYYHLHIEIYGMFRDEGKLKYAAGIELGGGNFTYDAVPEENAERLREKVHKCCTETNVY